MKVFLDTNVVIGGHKCPEHFELKGKSRQGQINLYFSIDVDLEQSRRSLDYYFGPYSNAFEVLKSKPPRDIAKSAYEMMKKQHEIELGEKAEWEYWSDCHLEIVQCTFSGLISIAQVYSPELLMAIDTKGEINLLEELLSKYNVDNLDAIHLMTAHSAEIDFFLTWDKKLIKQANKVKWLKPKVLNPAEFLDTLKSNKNTVVE